ncbi:hypothetical protein F7Q99_20000 [Streptomyces kaniharaensis]|uniref:Uncharacterized protein n=1 Tax=Streptomyces kaniharaensis TaxID=212423 RepID=A0A6N7KWV4_9ACTN|nr:hypothetical protein [Streptomyces kaniharaensis]MQS14484.1 hypothetical protein [Streptomyces kaniharaensis]
MNDDQTVALIQQAIGSAAHGDIDTAARALESLGQASDNNRMYGVCCAIATTGTHTLRLLYGSQAPTADNGAMWATTELTPGAFAADPAEAFAMRFLVAYSNGDTDTCLALFETALKAGGEQYVSSVCALLTAVAKLVRLALDEKAAGRLPA